jgi:hypothetical protein
MKYCIDAKLKYLQTFYYIRFPSFVGEVPGVKNHIKKLPTAKSI